MTASFPILFSLTLVLYVQISTSISKLTSLSSPLSFLPPFPSLLPHSSIPLHSFTTPFSLLRSGHWQEHRADKGAASSHSSYAQGGMELMKTHIQLDSLLRLAQLVHLTLLYIRLTAPLSLSPSLRPLATHLDDHQVNILSNTLSVTLVLILRSMVSWTLQLTQLLTTPLHLQSDCDDSKQ